MIWWWRKWQPQGKKPWGKIPPELEGMSSTLIQVRRRDGELMLRYPDEISWAANELVPDYELVGYALPWPKGHAPWGQ